MTRQGIDSFKEGPKETRFIDSFRFQLFIGFLICLNAAEIGLEADLNRTGENSIVWDISESAFLVIWIAEAVVRLHEERVQYFCSCWNLLDLFLVILGVFETWILRLIIQSSGGSSASLGSLSVLRLLRILRMLRLLRLIKLARLFKELWLIINGFLQSLRTLAWVLLLLFLVIYSGGIYMTIIVGHTCETDYADWHDPCEELFGGVVRSMYTLFQVMTFESWSMVIARPVLKEKAWLFLFFLAFLMITSFGLLNIIVGVIVENTLEAADEQRVAEEESRRKEMSKTLTALRRVFEEADTNGDGILDLSEFRAILEKPDVAEIVKGLELPIAQPDRLFEAIDQEENGNITIAQFIDGALKLKEAPSPLEMRVSAMQVRSLWLKMGKLEQMMAILLDHCGLASLELVSPRTPPSSKRQARQLQSLPSMTFSQPSPVPLLTLPESAKATMNGNLHYDSDPIPVEAHSTPYNNRRNVTASSERSVHRRGRHRPEEVGELGLIRQCVLECVQKIDRLQSTVDELAPMS